MNKNLNVQKFVVKEDVCEINLTDIHPFKDHPFKVLDDERMMDTAESIRAYGVLIPVIVRSRKEGGFEMISGHRRKRGSELAGLDRIPAIVRDLDDDAATIVMVDSNLQRETLLPSEKAFAYKMKMDAIKRSAGRTAKKNCDQIGHNSFGKRSVDILAEDSPDSRNQIQRYIRLTELIPPILTMVDERKIAFNTAVELSYLSQREQELLLEAMDCEQTTPSLSQALRIKRFSQERKITETVLQAIMSEEKKTDVDKLTLTEEKIGKYFPKSYTLKDREKIILKLLEAWSQRRHGITK